MSARRVALALAGLTLLALGAGTTLAAAQGRPRFGVPIPMRDGVRLVADVWLPDSGGPHPTILLRTPYVRTPQFKRYRLANYVKRGYAVVLQDTRGRGDSEGEFDFYFPEGKDGHDTIEWIAKQSWSNGRVAMDGGSYLGTVQWLAARERPRALSCIAPTASSGRLFDEIPYLGGAFRMDWALPWLNLTAGRVSQGDLAELVDWRAIMKHRPLRTMDEKFGRTMPLYRAFLEHDTMDEYWKRIQFGTADFARIDIPVLTVTGWYDGDQGGALSYWDGMERRDPGATYRFLIIGPWTHTQTYLGGERRVGAFELAAESILDIQEIRLAFFDWCLKRSNARFEAPRVRVYVTGANRWVNAERYPLPDAEVRPLYLTASAAANSVSGGGRLSWQMPNAEPPDTFTYDPRNPVPSNGVARDHRDIEARADVLVFSTDVLTAPVEVVGRVLVRLFAASDARDTDFTAKLLDVYPDGRAILLGSIESGARRARYRHGYERSELLTAGRAEEYSIELFDIGHRFLSGHRIRLEISSSAAPFIHPNPNTGNPIATDTTSRVARQTIYHDAQRASRVLLPVLPIRDSLPAGARR